MRKVPCMHGSFLPMYVPKLKDGLVVTFECDYGGLTPRFNRTFVIIVF